MSRLSSHLLLCAALAAPQAAAFERGDQCTLKAPVPIKVRTKAGTVEALLEKGADITVNVAGEDGVTRVEAGDTIGTVVTVDLEAACAGTLRLCRLKAPVTMYEKNRSDSRQFKIKAGADLSILKKGKTWAAVRVGDLMLFAETSAIAGRCASGGAEDIEVDASVDVVDGVVEEIERGDGPGVLLVPFSLEGSAPAGAADGYFQQLWERITSYRPDAGKLEDDSARKLPWKKFVDASVSRAKNADMRYVLVGRVFIDDSVPPKPGEVRAETHVLQLGMVEVKSGKMLKGIRVKPSPRLDDPWPEFALAKLLPEVASAPGSRLPEVKGGTLELAQQPAIAPEPEAPSGPAAPVNQTPWFANPLAYGVMGAGVLLGVGGGVLGWLALQENTVANETPRTDATRAEHRNGALLKGAVSDVLVGAGVVGLGVGVGFLITRTGIE